MVMQENFELRIYSDELESCVFEGLFLFFLIFYLIKIFFFFIIYKENLTLIFCISKINNSMD